MNKDLQLPDELNSNNDITKSLGLSIFGNISADLLSLAAESAINIFSSNDLVKSIPIVGAVISLCKFGVSISNLVSLKKTINFIRQLNENTLNEKAREKHLNKLKGNDKALLKELEKVILILENASSIEKTKVLGNLYFCFLDGRIKWNSFCELAEANNRMFDSDYSILFKKNHTLLISGQTKIDEGENYSSGLDRMVGLGLFSKNQLTGILYTEEVRCEHYKYFLTNFGELFIKCATVSTIS